MRRGFHSTTMCEVAACGVRGMFFEASQRLRSVAVPRIHDERDHAGRVRREFRVPLERLFQSEPGVDLNRKPRVDLLKAPE